MTVNAIFYKAVLDRLLKRVPLFVLTYMLQRIGFFCTIMCLLTTPLSFANFWPKKGVTVLHYPSYSPDIAPADFFLIS